MKDESDNPSQVPVAGGDQPESPPPNAATDEERKRVVEHLTHALDAEENPKKEFHIREALQLLRIEER